MAIRIEPAQFPMDSSTIHNLFCEYAVSLGIDITFQQFQDELDSLPGKYAESEGGALLVAWTDGPVDTKHDQNNAPAGTAVGCIALRRSSDTWSEMKRLYVLREARGTRLGAKLVEAIIARAKDLGYHGIRLDTLANMTAAQQLYRKCGFVEIEPYYETPVEGTIFMGCELRCQESATSHR
ncbi:acetyltransferase [Aspergillus sp. HF37]|nr:acetyltransferase [Aspergillus sp. HF37]